MQRASAQLALPSSIKLRQDMICWLVGFNKIEVASEARKPILRHSCKIMMTMLTHILFSDPMAQLSNLNIKNQGGRKNKRRQWLLLLHVLCKKYSPGEFGYCSLIRYLQLLTE
ncbi:hypothetical protein Dimus_000635 [Dionaea muscipula]